MWAETNSNHIECGALLGIGEEFLFINKFSIHEASLKATARIPTCYEPVAHFGGNVKVPASVLLEFASQSAAIFLKQLASKTETPLVVDLKIRVIRSVDDLTKTTCLVHLEKKNKTFSQVRFQIFQADSLELLAKGNLVYGN